MKAPSVGPHREPRLRAATCGRRPCWRQAQPGHADEAGSGWGAARGFVEHDGACRAGTREAITLTVSCTTLPGIHSPTQSVISTPTLSDLDPGATASRPRQPSGPVREDSPTFAELGVREEIVQALRTMGIERAFAIQELTLPLALAGHDLIGQARTGTGKTLSFGVPLIQQISSGNTALDGVPHALVIVPTRELCLQVSADVSAIGRLLGIRVLASYGGRAYEPQITALARGVDVVVGTPGRLLDLAERGHLVLDRVRVLVLDEADEMLDLGFLPDVERILRIVPKRRQSLLFSATMPDPIIMLARSFLIRPTHVRAEEPDTTAIAEGTRQLVYRAHALDKVELLARLLQARGRGLTMIFTRTKRTAQKVADELLERGFAVAAVHGDLRQAAREQALRAFRSERVDVLVATDVAARGLDVPEVTHVINYQCPEDGRTYVHRIGRTGRAGRPGMAVTLVDWDEEARWTLISDTLGLGMPCAVETYSTSPHVFADLDIPLDAGGQLPPQRRSRAGLAAEPAEQEDPCYYPSGPARSRRRRGRRGSGGQATAAGAAAAHGKHAAEGGARSIGGVHRQRRRGRRSGRTDPASAGAAQQPDRQSRRAG